MVRPFRKKKTEENVVDPSNANMLNGRVVATHRHIVRPKLAWRDAVQNDTKVTGMRREEALE